MKLILGDCIEKLKELEANSIDAIVTDPPYLLEFMGKSWDKAESIDFIDSSFGNWVAGFIDGEGCFVNRKSGKGFVCEFIVHVRNDDKDILKACHQKLGIGDIREDLDRKDGSNKMAKWVVNRQQDCLKLIEFLQAFPLRAKKKRDFEIWSESVREWVKHEPNASWGEIGRLSEMLSAIKQYGAKFSSDQFFHYRWAKECYRVLKPGGHLLAMGGTRTFHRLAAGIEDAGFEVRDMVEWVYGSGFPKSLNIGKAVDKLQGNKRIELGDNPNTRKSHKEHVYELGLKSEAKETKGTSEWEGWGTALKPSHEPIAFCRKPLAEKSVAENVLKWGTGGINIDESRVDVADNEKESFAKEWDRFQSGSKEGTVGYVKQDGEYDLNQNRPQGRFPANLCWSCDCDNNYLTGNALFDILSNISNQIKLCQLNNSNSNALNVEQKKHQQDTTSEEKKLCFAVENVDTLFLEKILGKTLEVIFSVNTECSAEMLEESMNTSLSISLSGNEKMEEYQKVLKFITLTATRLITELKTCNLSQSQIIGSFITKVISGIREQSQVKSHSPECWVRECFPDARSSGKYEPNNKRENKIFGGKTKNVSQYNLYGDSGNASRFFKSIIYTAKASKSERNMGCEGFILKTDTPTEIREEIEKHLTSIEQYNKLPDKYKSYFKEFRNDHPTVKTVALCEYLIKMITPKGGVVLDPFMGSGSTGIACKKNGFDFIGIEKEEPYYVIACARIKSAKVNLAELIKKL